MIRPAAIVPITVSLVALVLAFPALVLAHGGSTMDFRTTILAVEPDGLPVDVRIVDGDEIRFENAGDRDLLICGYDSKGEDDDCGEWVRIGSDGVFVDRDSRSYFANVDEREYGEIPEDAGQAPDWQKVRERPPFYAYHDHRIHWMGLSLPPNVDPSDPEPQRVFDAEVRFRYGSTDGVVRTRLEYVGGSTWVQRHGEQALVGIGIGAMVVVFLLDARRRKRENANAGGTDDA